MTAQEKYQETIAIYVRKLQADVETLYAERLALSGRVAELTGGLEFWETKSKAQALEIRRLENELRKCRRKCPAEDSIFEHVAGMIAPPIVRIVNTATDKEAA